MSLTRKDFNLDFIGVGMPKSGTTWVARCLEEHPEIAFSSEKTDKELNFFNSGEGYFPLTYFARGRDWYESQFPPRSDKITGEFSVSYFTDPSAPRRIREFYPRVKVVVLLRNPVEMLYSWYWWKRTGLMIKIPTTFREAINQARFVELGRYGKHYRRYRRFFPEDQIKILLHDDLKKDPLKFIQDLFRFLNVRDDFHPRVVNQVVNASIIPRSEKIHQFIAVKLQSLERAGFAPLIKKLAESSRLYNVYWKMNVVRRQGYPEMRPEERDFLLAKLKDDIFDLEKLINRRLACWREIK